MMSISQVLLPLGAGTSITSGLAVPAASSIGAKSGRRTR